MLYYILIRVLDLINFITKLPTMTEIQISKIDGGARLICSVLQGAGYQAYIVGGCVRDLLLKNIPKDWDICTDASPENVMSLFTKTYPTGLQHGTVTVSMGDTKADHYEVTTFRTETDYSDGRHPDKVTFVKNVEEDLLRRDFTINAIAYDPINDKLVDPFHGRKDLEMKIIRAVGHGVSRFTEDGLRIMRAARFAARLNYTIEHTTLTGMAVCSYMLESISKERIKDELCKILQTKNPAVGLRILKCVEAWEYVFPGYLKTDEEFSKDILQIDSCEGNHLTKLSILFGSDPLIENKLREMTFSNDEIKKIVFITNTLSHLNALNDCMYVVQDNKLMVRMLLARIKTKPMYNTYSEAIEEFIKFLTATNQDKLLETVLTHRNQTIWARHELQISGKDLLELNVKPGPKFKQLLDVAYWTILKYPTLNTNDYLRSIVAEHI